MLPTKFGFLYFSRLSKVEELLKTSSRWNLKNIVIITRKAICTASPKDLIIVWGENEAYLENILVYSIISNGSSQKIQKISVIIM